MKLKSFVSVLVTIILLIACGKKKEAISKEYSFDFNESRQGWDVLFSDYPVSEEGFYELSFTHSALPAPLNNSIKSLKINGNNHSDDLLSIVYKKIDGLQPNTRYTVQFDIEFASNTCISCAGVGGSPNLALGAGGLSFKPENNITNGYYRPNFTTEIQGYRSNNTMKVLGRIGTSETPLNAPFKLLSLNNTSEPIHLTTNANGELWIIMGTDSGFEATTTLYYTKVKIKATPL